MTKKLLFPMNYRFFYYAVFVVRWILEIIHADEVHNDCIILYFIEKIIFLNYTVVIFFQMIVLWLKSCFIPINISLCYTFHACEKMSIGIQRWIWSSIWSYDYMFLWSNPIFEKYYYNLFLNYSFMTKKLFYSNKYINFHTFHVCEKMNIGDDRGI